MPPIVVKRARLPVEQHQAGQDAQQHRPGHIDHQGVERNVAAQRVRTAPSTMYRATAPALPATTPSPRTAVTWSGGLLGRLVGQVRVDRQAPGVPQAGTSAGSKGDPAGPQWRRGR